MDTINQTIHNHLKPLYIWGCESLDNVEGSRVKIAIGTSTLHTNTRIHRQTINDRWQQLMDAGIVLHGSWAKFQPLQCQINWIDKPHNTNLCPKT